MRSLETGGVQARGGVHTLALRRKPASGRARGSRVSEANFLHNRAVWFDITVSRLERAATFYRAVLDIDLHREQGPGADIYVFDHAGGNGGCLIQSAEPIQPGGVLIYLNVDGRIRDALIQVQRYGGTVVEPIQAIGPHGYRAVVLDCEGNRVALHSSRLA